MPMSERDKERFRRQCESLAETELPADQLVEGEALIDLIRSTNEERAARGLPPIEEPDLDDVPEQELYDRFRALGMARIRR